MKSLLPRTSFKKDLKRIEKRGYDAYTLTSLRRYVQALGDGYALEVRVRQPVFHEETPTPVATR